MGIVFVLLLGEIDLSAGVAGGASATIIALMLIDYDWTWWMATLAGVAIGAVIGLDHRLAGGLPRHPVVRRHPRVLPRPAGGAAQADRRRRLAALQRRRCCAGSSIKNVPVTAGWIAAIVIVVGFAALSLWRYRSLSAKGLVHEPIGLVVLRIAVLAVIVLGLTALLSANRAPNPNLSTSAASRGSLPVVIALLLFWTFVLTKTRFGRHLYAVGGNAEAARRAGINVRPGPDHGVRHLLLDGRDHRPPVGVVHRQGLARAPVAATSCCTPSRAAVIGGTSLFGGRGRAMDAVIGGLVIATIPNGLGLLNQAAYINFLVTGGVLLLAASVDAISRRRRSSAGV